VSYDYIISAVVRDFGEVEWCRGPYQCGGTCVLVLRRLYPMVTVQKFLRLLADFEVESQLRSEAAFSWLLDHVDSGNDKPFL
jgi:hypothetical protein